MQKIKKYNFEELITIDPQFAQNYLKINELQVDKQTAIMALKDLILKNERLFKIEFQKGILVSQTMWKLQKILGFLYTTMGWALIKHNKIDKFMMFHKKAIEIIQPSERDQLLQGTNEWQFLNLYIMIHLSFNYMYQNDLKQCLEILKKISQNILPKLQKFANIQNEYVENIYHGIALLQYFEDKVQSLNNYYIVLRIKEKNNQTNGCYDYHMVLYRICKLNMQLKNYTESMEFRKKIQSGWMQDPNFKSYFESKLMKLDTKLKNNILNDSLWNNSHTKLNEMIQSKNITRGQMRYLIQNHKPPVVIQQKSEIEQQKTLSKNIEKKIQLVKNRTEIQNILGSLTEKDEQFLRQEQKKFRIRSKSQQNIDLQMQLFKQQTDQDEQQLVLKQQYKQINILEFQQNLKDKIQINLAKKIDFTSSIQDKGKDSINTFKKIFDVNKFKRRIKKIITLKQDNKTLQSQQNSIDVTSQQYSVIKNKLQTTAQYIFIKNIAGEEINSFRTNTPLQTQSESCDSKKQSSNQQNSSINSNDNSMRNQEKKFYFSNFLKIKQNKDQEIKQNHIHEKVKIKKKSLQKNNHQQIRVQYLSKDYWRSKSFQFKKFKQYKRSKSNNNQKNVVLIRETSQLFKKIEKLNLPKFLKFKQKVEFQFQPFKFVQFFCQKLCIWRCELINNMILRISNQNYLQFSIDLSEKLQSSYNLEQIRAALELKFNYLFENDHQINDQTIIENIWQGRFFQLQEKVANTFYIDQQFQPTHYDNFQVGLIKNILQNLIRNHLVCQQNYVGKKISFVLYKHIKSQQNNLNLNISFKKIMLSINIIDVLNLKFFHNEEQIQVEYHQQDKKFQKKIYMNQIDNNHQKNELFKMVIKYEEIDPNIPSLCDKKKNIVLLISLIKKHLFFRDNSFQPIKKGIFQQSSKHSAAQKLQNINLSKSSKPFNNNYITDTQFKQIDDMYDFDFQQAYKTMFSKQNDNYLFQQMNLKEQQNNIIIIQEKNDDDYSSLKKIFLNIQSLMSNKIQKKCKKQFRNLKSNSVCRIIQISNKSYSISIYSPLRRLISYSIINDQKQIQLVQNYLNVSQQWKSVFSNLINQNSKMQGQVYQLIKTYNMLQNYVKFQILLNNFMNRIYSKQQQINKKYIQSIIFSRFYQNIFIYLVKLLLIVIQCFRNV